MKFGESNLLSKDKKIVEGPLLVSPNRFEDSRGFLLEEWNEVEWIKLLEENEQNYHKFVQDNLSKSSKGVLRGLHFQIKKPQGKLISVIKGEIFDVAVDMRKNSKTFGKHLENVVRFPFKTNWFWNGKRLSRHAMLDEETNRNWELLVDQCTTEMKN